MFVRVISSGVTGKDLNSTFEHRDSVEYKLELGNTIANFVRTVRAAVLERMTGRVLLLFQRLDGFSSVAAFASQVPDGVLVFFPSYSTLAQCTHFWQSHDSGALWKRIQAYKVCKPTRFVFSSWRHFSQGVTSLIIVAWSDAACGIKRQHRVCTNY